MATVINGKGTVGVRGGATVGAPIITQFITTWKTNNAGTSTSTQIRIPTTGTGYACTVDWGDGTSDSYSGTAPVMLHTYPSAGTYTVKISGTFPRMSFNSGGDRLKLLTIEYWGTGIWSGSMVLAFQSCTNLKINAPDVPNFAAVTNMSLMFNGCSSLTSINVSGWNTSNVISIEEMFSSCTSLSSATGFNTWNLSNCTSITRNGYSGMFQSCTSLQSLDLSGWDLRKVTYIGNGPYTGLFYNCTALKNLNVSNWLLNTTSSVILTSTFYNCTSLSAITGLDTWNTSKVTSTQNMFYFNKLISLDLSNWNMSANTNMSLMFNGCSSLKSINLTGWSNKLTNITSTQQMFQSCTVLSSITGTQNWDLSKVTSISNMFNYCNNLTSLDLSGWNLSACTSIGSSQYDGVFASTGLKDINVSNWILNTTTNYSLINIFGTNSQLSAITGLNTWNTSKATSTQYMFQNCNKLISLDLNNWNMSANTNMSLMFLSCSTLKSVNTTGWVLNTNTTYSMTSMFSVCTSLTGITGIENWNNNKSNSMLSMFNACNNLTGSLNLSNWDTRNVTQIHSMFASCHKLTSLDLSGWNLSACTSFSGQYYEFILSSSIKNINVSNWILPTSSGSSVSMNYMINNCTSLTGITGLNTWNTSKVTSTRNMFAGCTSLPSLDLTGWNMSANTDMSTMFLSCSSLTNVTGASNWSLRTSGVNLTGIFGFAGLSTANYTGIIVGWANYVNTNGGSPSSVNMATQSVRIFQNSLSGGSGFANAGAARSYLTGTLPTGRAWSIAGDTVIA